MYTVKINQLVISAPCLSVNLTIKWQDMISQFGLRFIKTLLRIGLVSLFNGMSTFLGYLIPKLFLLKSSCGAIYSIAGGNLLKNERNCATGVWTHFLQCLSPVRKPRRHRDSYTFLWWDDIDRDIYESVFVSRSSYVCKVLFYLAFIVQVL